MSSIFGQDGKISSPSMQMSTFTGSLAASTPATEKTRLDHEGDVGSMRGAKVEKTPVQP